METKIFSGRVKFWNEDKNWGFITSDDGDIFFHYSGLVDLVKNGDKVSFQIGTGRKGPMACNIKLKNHDTDR
jgi:cold shock protein